MKYPASTILRARELRAAGFKYHDHGWPMARKTLESIRKGVELGRIETIQ